MITYKDFYPTDRANCQKLTEGLALINRRALEPQAGKGDLARYLNDAGATVEVCEIDRDLASIVSKDFKFIKHDFLQVQSHEVSHVDYIIMNPPFSEADKHILHAYKIAPEGCIIRSFMNRNTYVKTVTRSRTELKTLIDTHGMLRGSGKLFSDSERSTSVEVVIVELKKPRAEESTEWQGYFETEDSDDFQGEGLMQFDEVRNIVQRVVGAVKMYDEALQKAEQIHALVGDFPLSSGNRLNYEFQISKDSVPQAREEFKKEIQKRAWRAVFKKLNIEKYLTTKVKEDVDKFVEVQEKVPFTMKNIYEVLSIVIGTAGEMMKKTYLDVFDRLTAHYADNRWHIEGWKTNSHYMVNKKIIVPYVVDQGWTGNFEIKWGSRHAEILEDLYKLLCHMLGDQYNQDSTLYNFFNNNYTPKETIREDIAFIKQCQESYEDAKNRGVVTINFTEYFEHQVDRAYKSSKWKESLKRNTWYDWTYFEMKFYKKGTVHLKFKEEKVWRFFNKKLCEYRGYVLPENF